MIEYIKCFIKELLLEIWMYNNIEFHCINFKDPDFNYFLFFLGKFIVDI